MFRRTEVRRKNEGFTCVTQNKSLSGKQRFYVRSAGSRSIVKTMVLYRWLSPILVVDSDGGNITFVGRVYCKSRLLARGSSGKVSAVFTDGRQVIDTVESLAMSADGPVSAQRAVNRRVVRCHQRGDELSEKVVRNDLRLQLSGEYYVIGLKIENKVKFCSISLLGGTTVSS